MASPKAHGESSRHEPFVVGPGSTARLTMTPAEESERMLEQFLSAARELGISSAVTVDVPAAYHQVITNQIRATFGYSNSKNVAWRGWRQAKAYRKLGEIYRGIPMTPAFKAALVKAGIF